MVCDMDEMNSIIEGLDDIKDDNTVPKNIRLKIESIINTLREEGCDVSLKISRVLQELDEISEDSNLQPYTRTQIWNVASFLETL
ncbi:MAG: UPF0147 family protein [Candidatus Woesearchaeota archaeon]